ncbi:SCO3374 family protein [Streptomyces sp. LRE541]|uniref:SCO3374 family protein n=1 Tax=Streptomyces sp. LRE541 TaxID=2931983 RepID=UPI00200C03EC|nr:SCO3374 family protein [Streptomyces sp. LRE541]UPZ30539.1 SCO3374 family protein [Streptomyces sp. LRE541]
MVSTVPFPRRPSDEPRPAAAAVRPDETVRHWYENELGWATVPGAPVDLLTGLRFDVLEVPAEAGYAALRHLRPGSPVAVRADRMRLFVAAGSAEELPGLLDWLEWGALALDLGATGSGGRVEAPLPPGPAHGTHGGSGEAGAGAGAGAGEVTPGGAAGSQGAAVWLRPPEPGCEVESSLPTLSALGGGGGGAPDLVRLVETMASECHRIRLRRGCAQPLAFS